MFFVAWLGRIAVYASMATGLHKPLSFMLILGIETSCDETSAAIVEDGQVVRSCVIASSLAFFVKTGGVIPEYAARRQVESMIPVLRHALGEAGVSFSDLAAIAVTSCPGLLGSLLVGTTAARMLQTVTKLPLIPVHHTLGHLCSTWLTDDSSAIPTIQFPVLTLSVSGGHSDLWYRTMPLTGKLVGSTRDDAAGEAFDKGATLFGLPYPGGPALAKLAFGGDRTKHHFPLPLSHEDGFDFSFSGLKTALKYLLRDLDAQKIERTPSVLKDIAASYEHAIVQHLLKQTERVCDAHPDIRELHIVGGVSANAHLQFMFRETFGSRGIDVHLPTKSAYCTDNAAMIASAGYFLLQANPVLSKTSFHTQSTGRLQLETL